MANLIRNGGGNPYLRYDSVNNQIQAMDEDGNWVDIYATDQLPLPGELWLYKLPDFEVTSYTLKTETTGSGSSHKLGSGILFSSINLTPYNKLNVEIYNTQTSAVSGYNIFVSNSNNTSIVYDNATVLVGERRFQIGGSATRTAEIDISAITGVKTISVSAANLNTGSDTVVTPSNSANGVYCKVQASEGYIKNVWLSKV